MTRLHSKSNARTRRRLRVRSGFGLVEVLVALIVMSIGMLGLAGMLLQVARRATQLSGQNGRAAVATQVMNRVAALPYDQLGNAVGCTSVTNAQFSHTQCISVIDAGTYKSIRLVVTPADTRVRADTTFLIRSP